MITAALSASQLAAVLLPMTLRRLYIARDADAAGDRALAALTRRAEAAGIEALALSPRMEDFNDDLRAFGLSALRAQLALLDVVCFMPRFDEEAGAVPVRHSMHPPHSAKGRRKKREAGRG